ncbi:conserved hypothetical protein [Candidatus Sulfopaludibacter sp. SbA3]|nr:conserved hypothetical protein [Candidatus Sulfopaludibacter sp. SbA3]
MMLVLQHLGLIVLAGGLAYGQTFDAASVKPATPMRGPRVDPTGGPGSKDPGRIHYPAISLQYLLMNAYDVNSFQLQGPNWLDTEHFDVDATLQPHTTKAQFRTMLQNLLAERFKLATHSETKDVPGYSLIIKSKLKMKESAGPPAPPNDGAPAALKLGPDRYFVPPDRQGVFFQLTGMSSARSTFRQVTMAELAATLQNQLKSPVVDATGLTANYDFVLTYATEGLYLGSGRMPEGPGGEESPPDISSALSEQLGLKLESKKVSAQVVVIDHIEKTPIGN